MIAPIFNNASSGFSQIKTARPLYSRVNTLPFRLPSFTVSQNGQYSPVSITSEPSPNSTTGSPVSVASLPALMESADNDLEDTDMELDDHPSSDDKPITLITSHSPPLSFHQLNRPPRLKHHSLIMPPPQSPISQLTSARLPTPIHPSFPPTPSSLPYTPRLLSPHMPSIYTSYSPNRAMPSPIREDVMDCQLSRLSMSEDGCQMDSEAEDMLISPTASESQFGLPARKGRARSSAFSTMNRRIFTGYLAECEKCRNKVPGHYIHFLPV